MVGSSHNYSVLLLREVSTLHLQSAPPSNGQIFYPGGHQVMSMDMGPVHSLPLFGNICEGLCHQKYV